MYNIRDQYQNCILAKHNMQNNIVLHRDIIGIRLKSQNIRNTHTGPIQRCNNLNMMDLYDMCILYDIVCGSKIPSGIFKAKSL